ENPMLSNKQIHRSVATAEVHYFNFLFVFLCVLRALCGAISTVVDPQGTTSLDLRTGIVPAFAPTNLDLGLHASR
ncbi:MAG TPA: hypothetical protein VGG30_08780, partial [Pirellulales bacterium]